MTIANASSILVEFIYIYLIKFEINLYLIYLCFPSYLSTSASLKLQPMAKHITYSAQVLINTNTLYFLQPLTQIPSMGRDEAQDFVYVLPKHGV